MASFLEGGEKTVRPFRNVASYRIFFNLLKFAVSIYNLSSRKTLFSNPGRENGDIRN